MSRSPAILTIFSQNELAEVRTLFNSLCRFHGEVDLTAVLLERNDHTYINKEAEPFSIISAEDFFSSSHTKRLVELYGTLWAKDDLRRSIQPFAIEQLLWNAEAVLYADPSTYFLNSFADLFNVNDSLYLWLGKACAG